MLLLRILLAAVIEIIRSFVTVPNMLGVVNLDSLSRDRCVGQSSPEQNFMKKFGGAGMNAGGAKDAPDG